MESWLESYVWYGKGAGRVETFCLLRVQVLP